MHIGLTCIDMITLIFTMLQSSSSFDRHPPRCVSSDIALAMIFWRHSQFAVTPKTACSATPPRHVIFQTGLIPAYLVPFQSASTRPTPYIPAARHNGSLTAFAGLALRVLRVGPTAHTPHIDWPELLWSNNVLPKHASLRRAWRARRALQSLNSTSTPG